MKIAKIIGIFLVSILAIVFSIGYLQPSEVLFTKSILIKAPIEIVFSQVNDLEKRQKWSPWIKYDSTVKVKYNKKQIVGKGAGYQLYSTIYEGVRQIQYVEVEQNKNIVCEIKYNGKLLAKTIYSFKQEEDGVIVNWSFFKENISNPFSRIAFVLRRKSLEDIFEAGLKDLKVQALFELETNIKSQDN